MLTTQACLSFSLRKYPYPQQERGRIPRHLTSFKTQRRGFVVPFQRPVNQVHSTWNGKHDKYSLGYCSSRISALASNQENIENLPLEQHGLEHEVVPKPEGGHQTVFWISGILKLLKVFIQFCRPQGVIFLVVQTTMISLLPVETMADLSSTFYIGLLKVLVATILMQVYVVGVNQLYDIEIDKVNKPHLPLASGDFSMATGVALTLTSCLLSFAMGFMSQSLGFLCGLTAYFLYGTIYSVDLPFLRWKRDPLLTTLITMFSWGIGLQIPYFIHFQKFVLGKPMALTKPLIFSIPLMSLFSIILVLIKDIPDVQGDKGNGIDTFAIRLGEERAFSLAVNMWLTGYGIAMMIGASSSIIPYKLVTVLGHFTLAVILWVRAKSTDVMNESAAKSFYIFMWKLFYAEYLLIPFVR